MFNPYAWLSHRVNRRWIYPLISAIMAIALVVSSSYPSSAFSVRRLIGPGLEVLQLSTMSDAQEVALGQQINQQILSRQFRRYGNTQINNYVTEVGDRLVAQSDRPNLPYTFQVVEDDSINAFATMGGFVYVTTGLLQAMDNEAQLAGVMSHEIGHIVSKHSIRQMREVIIARGLAGAAGVDSNIAVQLGVELALRLPRSRQHEYEADRGALAILLNTGYSPLGLVQFFEKLLDKPSPPTFLSTHPASSDRIAALEQMIPAAQANQGMGLDGAAYRERIRPLL
ncbi:M48 family metallopeptidase [Laspinema olomoucense]|uniref:M48 family metallopeptidase n=1 Tax=Laspinema olomoucense D3b TaxID=2953688 RepID=A0ABT2N7G9_9CYAN|nr:M48 family metallopeptidase [Laspinema sp. D3b]MCT7978643.1 M48 family metallopeptidase [Laspinema sp. D3b]